MLARRLVSARSSVLSAARRALHVEAKPLNKDVKEVEIKVPWGKVAGKLWGAENKQPLLALHGWQDNAGSFDNLAPFLVKHIPVLAIDMPGHGLSSWLPPGAIYTELVYIMLIQRLKQQLGWRKVKLMGHSLGAQTCFWYASLFPEEVEFVVALDCLKFPSIDVPEYNKLFSKALQTFYKIESQESPTPSYPEEEVIKRWIAGAIDALDKDSCKTLILRGTTRKDDGTLVINRDPRLKIIPVHTGFTHNHLMELAKLIVCPYLVIKAEDSPFFEDKKNFYEALELMKVNNRSVHYEMVPGPHHVHLTNPEIIASIIDSFLERYN